MRIPKAPFTMKKLILILSVPFLLLSWSQGCGVMFGSDTRFSAVNSSDTQAQATEDPGHGGTYDGKLRVLHHYEPGFQCEHRNAPESILINKNIDQESWLIIKNAPDKCAYVDGQPVSGVLYDDVKKEAQYEGKTYVAPKPYWVDANEDPNLPDLTPLDAVCADVNGKCSLQAALQSAQVASHTAPAQIQMPAAHFKLSRELSLTAGPNEHAIHVDGAGSEKTILDGQGTTNVLRLFGVATSGAVQLQGFTLQNGYLPYVFPTGTNSSATALENNLPAQLNLIDIIFSKNSGADTFQTTPSGGGVSLRQSRFLQNAPDSWLIRFEKIKTGRLDLDKVEMTDTKISRVGGALIASFTKPNTLGVVIKNSLIRHTVAGCALYFQSVDEALIENSTIADNDQQALTNFGSDSPTAKDITFLNATIYNNGATTGWGPSNFYMISNGSPQLLNFKNTIVAEDNPAISNCVLNNGAQTTATNSLISDSTCRPAGSSTITAAPQLGPWADNGGFTMTRLPLNGSPTIDAGANAICPAADQRGFSRPVDHLGHGPVCDIGAVEVQ